MSAFTLKRQRARFWGAAVVAAVSVVGVADAAERQPAAGEPALRGPEVRERNVPGAPGAFGAEGETRRLRERVPLPVFRDAVMSLQDEDVAAEVRLSDDQMSELRRHQQEFESKRREYMMQHRDEMRELRARGGRGDAGERRGERGERGGSGGGMQRDGMMGGAEDRPQRAGPPGDGRDGEMTPERRAAAERLREIDRAGPQPEDLYTKIWAELSEGQRVVVESKLDEFRAARAKEREEAYVRQRAAQGEAGPGAGRPMEMDGPARAPGREGRPPMMEGEAPRRPAAQDRRSPQQRERIERLVRVFSELPPEEQERILSRLEERVREVQSGREAPGRDAPRRRPERRPPPSMDEVEVPRPNP